MIGHPRRQTASFRHAVLLQAELGARRRLCHTGAMQSSRFDSVLLTDTDRPEIMVVMAVGAIQGNVTDCTVRAHFREEKWYPSAANEKAA